MIGDTNSQVPMSPTISTIGLGSLGFTYGNVSKIKINNNVYVYNVYDGYRTSTGKVYIDTSVKTSYTARGILAGSNNGPCVSGIVGADSSGAFIDVTRANEWLFGSVTVVVV